MGRDEILQTELAEIHDRSLGFGHGSDHDYGEGKQGHKDGSGAKQPHERRRQGPEALHLQGIETGHGVSLPLHPEFLQDGEAEGDRQQDHAESPGHGGVPAHLADELVVGLNGQDPEVLPDQGGNPEVLDAQKEDDQSPGENRRGDDREGHREKNPEPTGPEVGGRLFEGPVNGVDGRGHHEKDKGKKLQGEDQDDPLPTIDGRDIHADLLERLGEEAVPTKQEQPGLGADKGGEDQGQGAQSLDEVLARDVKTRQEKSEGDADDQGPERGEGAHGQAVPQASQVVGIMEEVAVALQGQLAGLSAQEARLEDLDQGVNDRQKEDG